MRVTSVVKGAFRPFKSNSLIEFAPPKSRLPLEIWRSISVFAILHEMRTFPWLGSAGVPVSLWLNYEASVYEGSVNKKWAEAYFPTLMLRALGLGCRSEANIRLLQSAGCWIIVDYREWTRATLAQYFATIIRLRYDSSNTQLQRLHVELVSKTASFNTCIGSWYLR